MSQKEVLYAETYPEKFVLGIQIGESAVRRVGRKKNHHTFPVIIENADERIKLHHDARRLIDELIACDSIELGEAMTPQEVTAVELGSIAGYEHRTVVLEGAKS